MGLAQSIIDAIRHFDFRQIDADLAWLNQPNTQILTWESPEYPVLLKEIYDPPPVLYAQGQLQALQGPALAIIGSRHPSPIGQKNAWQFAKELAEVKVSIVSGLALGIDAQAHRGALAGGGLTVAVMGTGIDSIYPQQHRELAAAIKSQGLVLSEFPLKTMAKHGHFPQRNRIISGLAKACLVIEAALKSGSLITARLAMEQNREVMAIPGSIHLPQARGCHHLLQQGAMLVTSPNEVKDAIGLPSQDVLIKLPMQKRPAKNQTVLLCIGFETTTVDDIMECSGLVLDDVLPQLATLLIEGYIQVVPGGYMRCQE